MSSERFCIEALREHFPAPAYAVLDHVRSHTGYGGRERTIDTIVMGLWPSRGIELWGIEIKSSRSDWQRELRDPAKAERLFAEFDRFFLLTGDLKVAALDEIPEPWGWMAIGPKGRIVTKKAAPLNSAAAATSRRFLASLMRKVTEDIEAHQRQEGVRGRLQEGTRRSVEAVRPQRLRPPAGEGQDVRGGIWHRHRDKLEPRADWPRCEADPRCRDR